MGTTTFDFLNESLLFDEGHQEDYYASVSDADLLEELRRYRQHAVDNIEALHQEIILTTSRLKVFGARDSFSINRLKQSALYLDQVVLPDPLFQQSEEPSAISDQMSQFLGMPNNKEVDRKRLAGAASRMKALTPMVAADYVKFFPVSYYLEPDEQIPLLYSETGFADALPTRILSKYQENADVRSLRRTDQGLAVENSLRRGRHISVQFRGNHDGEMIYVLAQNEAVDVDAAARSIHFRSTLPDEPPPVDEFQAWVAQSINQAARAHYHGLLKELALSQFFGASYLTSSEFTHSLFGANDSTQSVEHHTADCILNFDLPYLEDITIHDLMKVRDNDGEAFRLFRTELERQLRELRTETDPETLKRKAENAVHELSVVQVAAIDQKIRSLKKRALVEATIAAGGLVATVVSSGWSIAATAVALASLSRSGSHIMQSRENPAYFLWKARSRK